MRPPRNRSPRGFAIIVVIWATGLIALLISNFVLTSRLRLAAGSNIASAFAAEALAEAAIGIARMRLSYVNRSTIASNGEPWFCSLGDESIAALSIEDEAGKLDLNAASQELFATTLIALGSSSNDALAAADAIAEFRSGTEGTLFQSVLEIEQINSITPASRRLLRSISTVHSRLAEPDLSVAPDPLYLVMSRDRGAGDTRRGVFPNRSPRKSEPRRLPESATIRAEVMTSRGALFVREVVLTSAVNALAGTYDVREWRSDSARYEQDLSALLSKARGLPPC